MTQQQTNEYNERCARFLGYPYDEVAETYETNFLKMVDNNLESKLTLSEMEFHTDWNWIMEVKSAICSSPNVDEFNITFDSVSKSYYCQILPLFKNSFQYINTIVYTTTSEAEKQAVIEAISQFLIWNEKQTTL